MPKTARNLTKAASSPGPSIPWASPAGQRSQRPRRSLPTLQRRSAWTQTAPQHRPHRGSAPAVVQLPPPLDPRGQRTAVAKHPPEVSGRRSAASAPSCSPVKAEQGHIRPANRSVSQCLQRCGDMAPTMGRRDRPRLHRCASAETTAAPRTSRRGFLRARR